LRPIAHHGHDTSDTKSILICLLTIHRLPVLFWIKRHYDVAADALW
jgi:hypothetical protein